MREITNKMRMVINFRKQETNIPLTCIFIYIYGSDQVSAMHPPPHLPPPPNYFGGKKRKRKKRKTKTKEKIEEDILSQNYYYYSLMSEVTDIPLLIRKYCIIKKGKSQTGH